MGDPYNIIPVLKHNSTETFEVYQCQSCMMVYESDENAVFCCVTPSYNDLKDNEEYMEF